jgi:hypothetical protein
MTPAIPGENPFVVHGHSGYLIVPIFIIPAVTSAAFGYFRETLPEFCIQNAEKVVAMAAALTLLLAVVAIFQRSRRIEVIADRLRYYSWLTDRTINVGQITAATFETELSGGDDYHMTEDYLTLWAGDDQLLRLSPQRWPREGLREILLRLRAMSVRMDRDVERYINVR